MRKYLFKFIPIYFYLLPSCVIYDATGKRSLEIKNGNYGIMIWDGDYVVAETVKNTTADASKLIANKYFRGHKLFANKSASGVGYYTYDAHGSVIGMSNESYVYDAFGNQITNTTTYNPFRYCGEYMEPDTGLIYLRNRYYDPSIGRFITEDPVKDGLNWYVYCGNNPILYVDPSGLDIYYYVNSEFRKEAEKDKKKLTDYYDEPVHILEVDSRDALIEEWNKMGNWNGEDVNVSLVVFNMHGSPNSLAPYSNSKTGRITAKDMEDGTLIPKNINNILVLGCNSGHFLCGCNTNSIRLRLCDPGRSCCHHPVGRHRIRILLHWIEPPNRCVYRKRRNGTL